MSTTIEQSEWIDKLAIEEVTVRYSAAATRGDWDEFEATWTPDAVWVESPPVSERVEGARAIREHVAAQLDKVDFLIQTTHGTVTTLEGDRARSSTTIHAVARVGEISFVNFGLYDSELVKTDGIWRFSMRTLQSVYSEYTPLPGQVGITRAELQARAR